MLIHIFVNDMRIPCTRGVGYDQTPSSVKLIVYAHFETFN